MTATSSLAMEGEGVVHLAVEGGIAHVTFDRPTARNAMTWRMYDQLADACARISSDESIRAVVLRGAGGRAFIAGTDIDQFRAFASGADGIAYEEKVEAYVRGVEALRAPTIAVVEGWAVGGGMAIANACDFRLATPGARFGVPIARTLGNCLSATNLARLRDTLGTPMVRRMLLLAEMPSAEELPPGYVELVAPDALDGRVTELTARIAGHAPVTLRVTKAMLNRLDAGGTAVSDTDLIMEAYGSADFREGVAAFLAKRSPRWTGA